MAKRQRDRGTRLARMVFSLAAAFVMAALAVLVVRGSARVATKPPPRLTPLPRVGEPAEFKSRLSFADARPLLAAYQKTLPPALARKTTPQLEAAWPAWVASRNAEIRARLERGDEDSLVNFWLYGTTFTSRPRITARDIARGGPGGNIEDVIQDRLDDLVAGMASPGSNERLQFARQVMARHGIDPATAAGREQAETFLLDVSKRVVAETDRYHQAGRAAAAMHPSAALSAFTTMFRGRGLSSDTSVLVNFSIDRTLREMTSAGKIAPGAIRRAAIVGPGLDFTDKATGYDFYPQQTIQPFALIDSLLRLGLAAPDTLQVTTLDLSPRVNQHLASAVERARNGIPYVMQLAIAADDPAHHWRPELLKYWTGLGGAIADEVPAIEAPAGVGAVRVRGLRVRPPVVGSLVSRDVNIVLERLGPLADNERFDLIVATNILVYYDEFEQSLALTNIAKMLRPGGFFLTNYSVIPPALMDAFPTLVTSVFWDAEKNGDTLFWYRRRPD